VEEVVVETLLVRVILPGMVDQHTEMLAVKAEHRTAELEAVVR
jgi:hypothetical protein